MSEDFHKHAKYSANLPYPKPQVEDKNLNYANILLQDYAGAVSELTAVNLYIYQHISSKNKSADYTELIHGISIIEMKHLELLGETIELLGAKAVFTNSLHPCGQLWNEMYVNFSNHIKVMLLEDIKSETEAIINYRYHMLEINDVYIKELINRIIQDEEVHLKYFKDMYGKYHKYNYEVIPDR